MSSMVRRYAFTFKARYSLRDMKAFAVARPLCLEAARALGADHPATARLRACVDQLALGCHRFRRQEKAQCYALARDQASLAVGALAMCADACAQPSSSSSSSSASSTSADCVATSDGATSAAPPPRLRVKVGRRAAAPGSSKSCTNERTSTR